MFVNQVRDILNNYGMDYGSTNMEEATEAIIRLSKKDKYECPKVTVDAIINTGNPNHIYLIKRKYPPYGWALPGGMVDYGESVEKAVVREVKEETSLDVIPETLKQQKCYSEPLRDGRFHAVSIAFTCKTTGIPKAADDAKEILAFDVFDLPEMPFDHKDIVQDYIHFNKLKPENL